MRSETDSFVAALRAQSQRYHDQHPFHIRMNDGRLSRRQIQGWVANRFYYQENLPRKDAAILANCPDREVRRRWIRRGFPSIESVFRNSSTSPRLRNPDPSRVPPS